MFVWLSLVMSMMVSFCAVFFPRGVLDEILNLIESVSDGFSSYSFITETSEAYYMLRYLGNQGNEVYNTLRQQEDHSGPVSLP